MPRKTITIPIGMMARKFYCHHCGQELQRNKNTILYRPGDPDYKKHAVQRSGGRINVSFGDVEITEYNFCCPDCSAVIEYEDQLVIENIQKNLGHRCLTQAEVSSQKLQATDAVERRKVICEIFPWIGFVLAAILLWCFPA